MLKLSKKAWIVLAIGIFIIAFASLNMAYSQQGQEQIRINQELSLAQLRLARFSPEELSSQQQKLENRLAHTEWKLEVAKASLRQLIESIEVTDTLFEVAETSGVEIIEINSPGLTSEELEGVAYSILALTAKVEGNVPNLINFILELNRKFPTGVLESVEIVVPGVIEGETGGEEIEEPAKPSAKLELFIHTYEGD